MRIKISALLALGVLLCAKSSQAQLFNLEDEDGRSATEGHVDEKEVSREPASVPAVTLPSQTDDDRKKFDESYDSVLSVVKQNQVDEGMKKFEKLDTITQQKIVDRMIKEYGTVPEK